MARAALNISTTDLATYAKVGLSTVSRFETGQSKPIEATISAMRSALEDRGVIFVAAGETTDGGPGVRLRE